MALHADERTRPGSAAVVGERVASGLVTLLVALLCHTSLPQGRFVPEPWPTVLALEETQEPALPLPQAA